MIDFFYCLRKMDLYFEFCNICYKTEDRSLKDISDETTKNFKNTLVTFVGHAEIINDNIINLCQLCCEELKRSNKFREMCFSNFVQLRQRVSHMKSKLELEVDASAVENMLQIFVREEVLRRNTLEKSNCAVLVPAVYEILRNDSIFNRQINLQSERNECQFAGECSDVSVINSTAKCEEPEVLITNDQFEMKYEMIGHPKGIAVAKLETVPDMDFEITKEFDMKNEIDINASRDYARRNYDSEGIQTTKDDLHVEKDTEFGNDMNVAFEFFDVSTIVRTDECGNESIVNEETIKDDITLRSTDCYDNSIASVLTSQQHNPSVRQYHYKRCPTSLKAGVHNRINPAGKPHMCSVCNKSFSTKQNLNVHERIHSGENPYKCTMCNKEFEQLAHLIVHQRIHSRDKPYICTVCKKTFSSVHTLIEHECIHSGERPYTCTVCNKTFRRSCDLGQHTRIHSDDSHITALCNKAFTTSYSLTVHRRIHTGERPYKCTVCKKAFRQSSDLTRHKRIHSGDKPFECTLCNKKFSRYYNLTVHERKHSGD